MSFINFVQSGWGRILRIIVGSTLLWYGAHNESLLGLVLMMVGLVPLVTGVLEVSLLEEVVRDFRGRTPRTVQHPSRAHERHV